MTAIYLRGSREGFLGLLDVVGPPAIRGLDSSHGLALHARCAALFRLRDEYQYNDLWILTCARGTEVETIMALK